MEIKPQVEEGQKQNSWLGDTGTDLRCVFHPVPFNLQK